VRTTGSGDLEPAVSSVPGQQAAHPWRLACLHRLLHTKAARSLLARDGRTQGQVRPLHRLLQGEEEEP
jgi:hypothetical protein